MRTRKASIFFQPKEGDLFYDIEGNPHYRDDNGVYGLEYLHGIWHETNGSGEFVDFWAHDRDMEAKALEDLFTFFENQFEKYPEARVYHYAHYEITALKRMTEQHGFAAEILGNWIEEGRFVDLLKVVRNGLTCSEEAYSIKNLEAFYAERRTEEVQNGGASIVAYEEWRKTGGDQIINDLREYNKFDCELPLTLETGWFQSHKNITWITRSIQN